MTSVHIIGSGISGLSCAHALQTAGCTVSMLAPFCEQESAEPLIGKLGEESMRFWLQLAHESKLTYQQNGTLVLASPRDQSLLRNFERQTEQSQSLDQTQITQLEPDLAHFQRGLFFAKEAHIEPRLAVAILWQKLESLNVTLNTEKHLSDTQVRDAAYDYDWQLDCRGLSANDVLTDLRGVKGEMLHIYSDEVQLKRPIRLLHPRYPLYIVPRPNNQFMVGATMIEANQSKRATVRSVLELLSAAYAVHPAFAEAEVVEIGVDARPAFDDNLPKIRRFGNQIYLNGLYRHGYLAAPAMARRVVDLILHNNVCTEVVDANYPKWSDHKHATNYA